MQVIFIPTEYCLGPFRNTNRSVLVLQESRVTWNRGLFGYVAGWLGQPPAVVPFHSPDICDGNIERCIIILFSLAEIVNYKCLVFLWDISVLLLFYHNVLYRVYCDLYLHLLYNHSLNNLWLTEKSEINVDISQKYNLVLRAGISVHVSGVILVYPSSLGNYEAPEMSTNILPVSPRSISFSPLPVVNRAVQSAH